ncbi:MAG: hypothetical protein AB7O62_07890 [Pirellulales bacterium]
MAVSAYRKRVTTAVAVRDFAVGAIDAATRDQYANEVAPWYLAGRLGTAIRPCETTIA